MPRNYYYSEYISVTNTPAYHGKFKFDSECVSMKNTLAYYSKIKNMTVNVFQ
jgi:hypothetical protein